ncbi:MAG: tRNA (adenosine(37)-N6)-threonylcarbamoyltransferase complex ATPase subunit type 1 TsaE [Chlamydiales bacterium]|nr:tRNA (adenosine(37)-N6)-threonylcarbamoyltransferase complex ATPase subunit type 1 TsaE [Chlamydiales bacterium]
MLKEYICQSVEDTQKLAQDLAPTLKKGAVLAFFGDLGTGKTTFIRYLSELLAGVEPEIVTSPTFQYVNIYKGHQDIFHFDLYRLQNSTDFIHMGFDEMLYGNGICCIEWAERISDILPPETLSITITHADNDSRLIQLR